MIFITPRALDIEMEMEVKTHTFRVERDYSITWRTRQAAQLAGGPLPAWQISFGTGESPRSLTA